MWPGKFGEVVPQIVSGGILKGDLLQYSIRVMIRDYWIRSEVEQKHSMNGKMFTQIEKNLSEYKPKVIVVGSKE